MDLPGTLEFIESFEGLRIMFGEVVRGWSVLVKSLVLIKWSEKGVSGTLVEVSLRKINIVLCNYRVEVEKRNGYLCFLGEFIYVSSN